MKESLRSVLVSFPGFLKKYSNNFQYLDSDEVKSGLLSSTLSSTTSQLMMNYLFFLIRMLKFQ